MTQLIENPRLNMARTRPNARVIMRIGVAAVLFAAAMLKASAQQTPIASRIVLPALEAAVAAWLISGRKPILSWLTAIVLFAAFAGISWDHIRRGEISCGCFGNVELNPWWSLTIDLAAIAALLHWHPLPVVSDRVARIEVWTFRFGRAFGLLALLICGSALSQTSRRATLSDGVTIPRDPRQWVGLQFPFSRSLSIDASIDRGLWTVVLVSQDCPECRREAPLYNELAEKLWKAGDKARVALITFNGRPYDKTPLLPPQTRCHFGVTSIPRLGRYDIVFPTAFIVQDGIVQYVAMEPNE